MRTFLMTCMALACTGLDDAVSTENDRIERAVNANVCDGESDIVSMQVMAYANVIGTSTNLGGSTVKGCTVARSTTVATGAYVFTMDAGETGGGSIAAAAAHVSVEPKTANLDWIVSYPAGGTTVAIAFSDQTAGHAVTDALFSVKIEKVL